ncbi:putative phosphatase [Rubidibacter lacunae KORDI 51-2]|uniref:Putative phosphatase n=1 Tax=Rubidibacter lacunae KORDI 51-2 TaxID=582515 RepID=U5DL51_9CHRO|nr:HAD hydrolase-like protein [Rubidibacter lacunae]ERN41587.1 putative phosphatase [Rubidibacter lacunae KORDI 51-2]
MNRDKLKLLVFDLDGVITSEQKYWNIARLTVWELLCSGDYLGLVNYFGGGDRVETRLQSVGDRVISEEFVYQLKSRAVNSNWDLTFFVFCLQLIGILAAHPDSIDILNRDRSLADNFQALGRELQGRDITARGSADVIDRFWQETRSLRGADVLDFVGEFATRTLGREVRCFDTRSELWQLCYENFQAWYEGKKGYVLPGDETVVPTDAIASTLARLSQTFTLAVATGRPKLETVPVLTDLGLLQYFDRDRIVTYDEVLAAESVLDNSIKLGKPHPFVIYKAARPEVDVAMLCSEEFRLDSADAIAYIGDAGSDVVAAQRAGCLSIGVLTGFAIANAVEQKRALLSGLGCNVILDSVLDLPRFLQRARSASTATTC